MGYVQPWKVGADDIAYIETFPPDQWPGGMHTLYTYYDNSFFKPSILSYVIFGTFSVFVLLVAASPILARLRLPLRRVERFLSAPTFGKVYSETLTIIPSPTSKDPWVSFHLPLRWQSFAILSFIIANIVGVAAFYTPTPGPTNFYWPESTTYPQIVRYLADRSGVLAQAQLVLVYLLAGRNSPVALLTRGHITFESLMLFHRWIARIVMVQAFIHSLAYSLYSIHYHIYESSFEPYLNWGVAAMVLLPLLCFLSLRSLRNAAYETFVIMHVLFAIMTVVAVYYHIWLLHVPNFIEYINYLYAIIAFWSFERGVRLIRLLILNVNFSGRSQGATTLFSTASLIASPSSALKSPSSHSPLDPISGAVAEDIPPLVLRIHPVGPSATRTGLAHWAPGQHIYLNVPALQPLSSHPFTVLSSGVNAPELLPFDASEDEKKGSENEKESERASTPEGAAARPYIDIALVPRAGLTKSLARRLGDTAGKKELTVFVDGPYGPALELESYSFIQLAAGGVGATYTLPFFIDAIRRDTIRLALGGKDAEAQPGRTPVHFTWAVKTVATAAFALPYLEHAILPLRASAQQLVYPYTISIHTTLQRTSKEVASSVQDDEADIRARFAALAPYISVQWFAAGRPSIYEAVDAAKEAVSVSGDGGKRKGKVAVIACGPASLCDDARAAAARTESKSGVRVDYYEESFTW